jgi:DNA-binding NarL/FixJ family response regulator
MRILLVEDEREVLAEIVAFLERRGHRVVAGSSVAQAEALLADMLAKGEPPDVVLSDLNLDDGDGVKLHRSIASRLPACRWVFMSGDYQSEMVEPLGDGPNRPKGIDKPFSFRDLAKLIEEG